MTYKVKLKDQSWQPVLCSLAIFTVWFAWPLVSFALVTSEMVIAEGSALMQSTESIDSVRRKAILSGLIKAINQKFGENMTSFERYTSGAGKESFNIGIHSSINGRGKILDVLSERVEDCSIGKRLIVRSRYEVFDRPMSVNYHTLNLLWQAINSPNIGVKLDADSISLPAARVVLEKINDIFLRSNIKNGSSKLILNIQLSVDRQKTALNTNHYIICTKSNIDFSASGAAVFSFVGNGNWNTTFDPSIASVQSITRSNFLQRLEENLSLNLYEFAFQQYYYSILE